MTRPVARVLVVVGLLAALAAVALWQTRSGSTLLPPLDGPLARLQHSGGLFVDMPSATVEGELTATGIRLRPRATAQLRRPWTLDLAWAPSPGVVVAGMRSWTSGERTLQQAPVTSSGAGSGGELYRVSAWTACNGGHVVASFSQQAEDADELDLTLAWQLVLASGCRDDGSSRR